MPNPKRQPPLANVDIRICRKEIRAVFHKYHNPSCPFVGDNLSATSCLVMLQNALDLLDPKFSPYMNPQSVRQQHLLENTGYFLSKHPVVFCELVLALDNSTKRVQGLPKNTPERIVEENFGELRDIAKNKKLSEALPNHLEAKGDRESQIRKRLSHSNKIIANWRCEFSRENSLNRYAGRLSENGQTVEIYDRR